MRECHNVNFVRGLAKYNGVRETKEHHSAGIECELRELNRTPLNPLQGGAKFDHQSTRSGRAAFAVPCNSGFGFALRLRSTRIGFTWKAL
jgi:hypothetical protein